MLRISTMGLLYAPTKGTSTGL